MSKNPFKLPKANEYNCNKCEQNCTCIIPHPYLPAYCLLWNKINPNWNKVD